MKLMTEKRLYKEWLRYSYWMVDWPMRGAYTTSSFSTDNTGTFWADSDSINNSLIQQHLHVYQAENGVISFFYFLRSVICDNFAFCISRCNVVTLCNIEYRLCLLLLLYIPIADFYLATLCVSADFAVAWCPTILPSIVSRGWRYRQTSFSAR